MAQKHWFGGALLAAAMLAGCGGGGDGESSSALTPGDAGSLASKDAEASADAVVAKTATAASTTPTGARLTVVNAMPVIQTISGVFDVMEDPDGSGPLPERRIMSAASGPTLTLPAATELAQVIHSQLSVVPCRTVPKITYKQVGWVRVPQIKQELESVCSGVPMAVRLDAPSIAQALAGDFNPVATSGPTTAFAVNEGGCKRVHAIRTDGTRDVVGQVDHSGLGNCSTRLSLAVAGEPGVLAIGAPDALDAQGQATGAAQVFAWSAGSWRAVARLTAPTPMSGDAFGTSVALSATARQLLVGAPGQSGTSGENSGAAFLFEAIADAVWARTQEFRGPAGTTGLGANVTISAAGNHVTFFVGGTPPSYCETLPTAMDRSNCILDFWMLDFEKVALVWRRQWRLASNAPPRSLQTDIEEIYWQIQQKF